MSIKKLFLISLCFAFTVAVAHADTYVDNVSSVTNIASTSYVKGGLTTRIATKEVATGTDSTTNAGGSVVTGISIVNGKTSSDTGDNRSDSLNKVIKYTTSNIKIPVGGASVNNSYTSIWVE